MADIDQERELTKDESEQLDECGHSEMTDEQRDVLVGLWREFKKLTMEGHPLAAEFVKRFTTVSAEVEQTGLTPNTSTNLRALAELLAKKRDLEVKIAATFIRFANAIDDVAREQGH